MSDSHPRTGAHSIQIGIREVYEQGQETREMVGELAVQIGELVAVNRRLDAHSKSIAEHDQRLDKIEIVQAVLQAQQKPRTAWTGVVSAIAAIIGGTGGGIALIVYASKIGAALG